jgi:hypothetical protein
MSLTLTREQRDAIYEVALNHLTGIGDVWTAIEKRATTTPPAGSAAPSQKTCGCSTTSDGPRTPAGIS